MKLSKLTVALVFDLMAYHCKYNYNLFITQNSHVVLYALKALFCMPHVLLSYIYVTSICYHLYTSF